MYRFNFYKRSLPVGKVAILFVLLILVYFSLSLNLPKKIAFKLRRNSVSFFAKVTGEARVKSSRSPTAKEPATYYNSLFKLNAVLISGDQKYAFLKRGMESFTVKEGMLIGKMRIESITTDSVVIVEENRKEVIKW
jgi:Tfp pilus assembly protein PilP